MGFLAGLGTAPSEDPDDDDPDGATQCENTPCGEPPPFPLCGAGYSATRPPDVAARTSPRLGIASESIRPGSRPWWMT